MNICVFGAASTEVDEIYYTETEKLGRKLADAGHDLIFGAGRNGMMGAVARGFIAGGAHVTGVAPKFFLPLNVLQEGCDEYIHHDTMAERKLYMEEHADAFVVTPGGLGTFDELFEVMCLNNLGQMNKPVIFFNINNFYTPLIDYIKLTIEQKFTSKETLNRFKVTDSADEVVAMLGGK